MLNYNIWHVEHYYNEINYMYINLISRIILSTLSSYGFYIET